MNTRPWGIALVVVLCAAAIGCVTYQYPPSYHQPVVTEAPVVDDGSDQPFYDDLEPYGRWVYASGPGWVWSPYGVSATWRPYQLGHWVYTDYGWTWASDESWGWAVYHYGRWDQDPNYGWVWVPGTEWGPAWVAWHEGGGYVGWAPLPWQVHVEAGVGINWGSVNVSIASNWWSFTATRYLVDPGLRTHIVPQTRNVSLVQVTQNVTNYTYIDNRIHNNGIKVEKVGRAVGRNIPCYRVADSDAPEVVRGGKVKGEDFVMFRPEPGRGRRSRGSPNPPGQEVRERAHDYHDAREDARRRVAPPAPEQETADQPYSPPAPPANENGQGVNSRDPRNQPGRGRKYYDDLMRKQPPRHGPQRPAPGQPAAADQGSGASGPSQDAPARPSEPQRVSPPSGDQHGPAAPPQRVAPPQRPGTKSQEARDAARGRRPKKDEPKSNDNKPDEPKDQKPNDGN